MLSGTAGLCAICQVRLFQDNRLDRTKDAWIYRVCDSSIDARVIEEYLIKMGMKGGPGGGDSTTETVYAYRITQSTLK
jgi:hypothetical protein